MKVKTDYFLDDGDGVHNFGIHGLDSGDEVLYQAISNPMRIEVTYEEEYLEFP